MKKFFILFFVILVNPLFSYLNTDKISKANEIATKYVQIQTENIMFYDSKFSPLFILPFSYYVEVYDCLNDFYKAKYLDVYGYVKKDEVVAVTTSPKSPFLENINFRILAKQSTELRTEPTRENGSSSLICELDLYETNLIFYGEINGEEVVPKLGNLWYYTAYTSNNQTKFGYIYAGLTDQKKEIYPLQIETENVIDEHSWLKNDESTNYIAQENTSSQDNSKTFTSKQIALITLISIPIFLLFFTFAKPKKLGKNSNLNKKSSIYYKEENLIQMPESKVAKEDKHKDYFELP